jgi:NAD(P)-dependent dehydrogenase (short-subunit alcohol dehydrogenase family)
MPGLVNGKVALVTGAASGIGRATALAFAREGARVVAADLVAEGGEQTAATIRAAGGQALFVRADVTVAEDAAALVRAAVESYGRLDCAFNNAGVGGAGGPTHECPPDVWAHILAVNLTGVFLAMQPQIVQMLAQDPAPTADGQGRRRMSSIVNTASIYGLGGSLIGTGASAYVASKHGVVGLTKNAAIEYAERGIRVNAVCPGFIRTGMTAASLADPERVARMVAAEPMGRIGDPEEIAAAVVWLSSDAASFLTGVALPVDGGLVAR